MFKFMSHEQHHECGGPRTYVKTRRVDQCRTMDELFLHCLPAFGGAYLRRIYQILDTAIGMGCPLTLAVSGLLVATEVIRSNPDTVSVIGQILFVPNYMKLFHVGDGLPGPPLWSLAVEEHYYLLFPAFFGLILARQPGKRAAFIILSWSISKAKRWKKFSSDASVCRRPRRCAWFIKPCSVCSISMSREWCIAI